MIIHMTTRVHLHRLNTGATERIKDAFKSRWGAPVCVTGVTYAQDRYSPHGQFYVSVEYSVDNSMVNCDKLGAWAANTIEALAGCGNGLKVYIDPGVFRADDAINSIISGYNPGYINFKEKLMKTNSVLDTAAKTVNSDRQSEYGDPVQNAVREAIVASVTTGKKLSPKDVVQVILAKKVVRQGQGAKTDTNVDTAGYAEILERVEKAMASGEAQKFALSLIEHLLPSQPKPKPEPTVVGEGYLDAVSLGQQAHRGNTFFLTIGNFIRRYPMHSSLPIGSKVKLVLDE